MNGMMGLPDEPGALPLTARPSVLELHLTGGLASLSVTFLDLLGAMDGVNEAGLSVALLADDESPTPEPSIRSQVGLSEQQGVRYLLETCRTVDEARDALRWAKQCYQFIPCHFLVRDRTGRAFVWERSRGHNIEHVVEMTGNVLACTNHLLHRWADGRTLPTGGDALTYDRYRTVLGRTAQDGPVGADGIRGHLDAVRARHPMPVVRTIWQTIYDATEPSVEVVVHVRDEGPGTVLSEPVRIALDGTGPAAGTAAARATELALSPVSAGRKRASTP